MKKTLIVLVFALLVPALVVSGCFESKPKLEIVTSIKNEYLLGEDKDVTGGTIKFTNEKGKETVLEITKDMIIGFDASTAGNKTMYVNYGGEQVAVPYTVRNLKAGYFMQIRLETYVAGVNTQNYDVPENSRMYLCVKNDITLDSISPAGTLMYNAPIVFTNDGVRIGGENYESLSQADKDNGVGNLTYSNNILKMKIVASSEADSYQLAVFSYVGISLN